MKQKVNTKELVISFVFIFIFFVAQSADQIYEKAKNSPACFITIISFIFTLLFIAKIIGDRKEKQQDIYINR
jgi:hypothetical protein